jgi:hypothetical protein
MPFRAYSSLMRQGRLEMAPRFLKCGGIERSLACQRQPTDELSSLNERSCL